MLKICLLILSLASLGSSRLMSSSLTQRIMPREANSCEERKSPGLICESCELLSICVNHSNGWFNIPVETCETENGFYCNSQLGMCSNMTGPCHPFAFEGNFPCTSPGVFPDPYDCQKYHMCYLVGGALISATVDCGGTTAFDPATGQCSLSQFDSVCTMKQFHCNRVGDAGPWPRNSNIFYICKATSNSEDRVLYPTLYRCGDGEIFDGYYCHDGNPQFTTQPGSWQTSTTQRPGEMSSTTSSTTSTTVRPSEMCSTIGLFPDTQNCRKYYYCSAISGEMKHFDCPMGTIYSPSLSSCIFGSC